MEKFHPLAKSSLKAEIIYAHNKKDVNRWGRIRPARGGGDEEDILYSVGSTPISPPCALILALEFSAEPISFLRMYILLLLPRTPLFSESLAAHTNASSGPPRRVCVPDGMTQGHVAQLHYQNAPRAAVSRFSVECGFCISSSRLKKLVTENG